ncbi:MULTISPECIES: TetR/AcrR family transcriptional regulator [Stenotrophomonas]|uniref:TetR/AcrR family transcriptional regulator n=1 Tax=Stenotrophomonas TaxID=40323 RepID=UPI00066AE71B|nr:MULTISPECIES: TetR/AcrR family transcriptional regulator [Stenotrophomonas]
MNELSDKADEAKSDLRRRQVLDAATECFRLEGFHGSSIARISRAAGMSAGHIYHYFANKEAIVEAIADREQDNMATLVQQLADDTEGGSLVARLTRQTAGVVQQNSDPAVVGLILELAAESARNPTIAQILQRSDRAIGDQFADLIHRIGSLSKLPEEEVRLRVTLIAAVVQGLAMRSIVEPQRDQEGVVRLLNRVFAVLLEDK